MIDMMGKDNNNIIKYTYEEALALGLILEATEEATDTKSSDTEKS